MWKFANSYCAVEVVIKVDQTPYLPTILKNNLCVFLQDLQIEM